MLIYIPQRSDFKWGAWYKPELLAKGLAVSEGVFCVICIKGNHLRLLTLKLNCEVLKVTELWLYASP